MALLGLPFDVAQYIIRMAEDRGIDWMGDVFYSPDFQSMLMQQQQLGPSAENSKGQPGSPNPDILQNGQPGGVMSAASGSGRGAASGAAGWGGRQPADD
jgi:hypothetical protein